MNRIKIVLGLLGVAAMVGCDNGPSFNVTAEAAGANCPTGGYRIEADGQTFYSCNGQATTEEIAEGVEGNPCFGPALRVSFPTAEGTRYAYVCQPVDVAQSSVDIFTINFHAMLASGRINCECTMDPEDQAACEQEIALYESVVRVSENCIREAIAAAGDLPESERPAIECFSETYGAFVDCLDSIDVGECSEETEAEVVACQEMVDLEACPEPTEAFGQWQSRVGQVASFLGCEFIGGI